MDSGVIAIAAVTVVGWIAYWWVLSLRAQKRRKTYRNDMYRINLQTI